MKKGFIGVTDNDWFAFLSQQPGADETNFLQLGAQASEQPSSHRD